MELATLKAENVMLSRETVETIEETDKIAMARLLMVRKGVGALPVLNGKGELAGMITFRDIEFTGDSIYDLEVRELMTKRLITVNDDSPLAEIAEKMVSFGLQRIPVVRGKELVGLVTQSTVIRALSAFLKGKI